MRIYAKRAYEFARGNGETHSVPNAFIGEVPDWVKDTPLFKLAAKSGNVEELTTREMEAAAEQTPDTPDAELLVLHEKAKTLKIKNYTKMGKDTLAEAVAKAEEEQRQAGAVQQ